MPKTLSKNFIKKSINESVRVCEQDIENYLVEQYKKINLSISFEHDTTFKAFAENQIGEIFSFWISYTLITDPIDLNNPNEEIVEIFYLEDYSFCFDNLSVNNVAYILSIINEPDTLYKLNGINNEFYKFDKNTRNRHYYLSFTHDHKLRYLGTNFDTYISGKLNSFLPNEDEIDLLFCQYLFSKNEMNVFNSDIPIQKKKNMIEINTFLQKYRSNKTEYLGLLTMLKI